MGSRTIRRWPVLASALAALTLLAAACGSSAGGSAGSGSNGSSKYPPIPAGPIKLGLSLPLSGPYAEYGESSETAFEKVAMPFFDKQNPNGIDGHKVVLDIQNDQGDSTTAVNVANEFVAQKVPVIIAPTSIPGADDLQIAIWNKNKVPVISNYVNEGIYANGEKWPYIFASLNTDQKAGYAAADWIAKQPDIKRLAILTDGVPADTSWITYLTAELKAKGAAASVVKTETITPGAVDVTTQLSQLKAAKPDLLLVILAAGYGPVWDGLHSLNWTPKVLAAETAFYDGYSSLGDLASTALSVTSDCLDPGTQVSSLPADVRELMAGYGKIEQINNMLIFVHADSVLLDIVKYAIEKYNSVAPSAIVAAMNGINQSFLWNQFTYHYTAQNHAGAVGHSEQVCKLSPLSDPLYRIPFAAAGSAG
jgi:ABC-type branched-subunit amino acid transport system substrate-binding protein